MVGDGCAGPTYPSIRIDQASASARSASRTASLARSRALSAWILAPRIRLPKMTSRDLVLMARHYSAILRRHTTPLGFEVWNGPVALQVR
jgi:hypothetical protein